MYTYSLQQGGASILRSDGLQFLPDPNNSDYVAYLAWVAAGNTPASADAVSLESAQATQTEIVSAACQAAIYAGFSSSALGSASSARA